MLYEVQDRLTDEKRRQILERFAAAKKKYETEKQQRVLADLALAQSRMEREEKERADAAALQERIDRKQYEKRLTKLQQRNSNLKPVREDGIVDKLAEAIATSETARYVALGMQAVVDSPVNPMSVYMRAGNWLTGNGYRTELENVVQPETKMEKALYEGVKTAYSTLALGASGGMAATTGKVTKAAASSNKLVRGAAKGFQYVAYPGALMPQVGAAEGALAATSLVNLEKPDENASFGRKARYAAANLGIGLAGGVAGGGVGGAIGSAFNRQAIKRGTKELARQLKTQEYSDIEMGRFSRKALMELNDIRYKEGVKPMRDNQLLIKADRVEHIYERRVRDGNMRSQEISNVVGDLVKAPKLTVKAGKNIRNQELSYIPNGATSGYAGYVSVVEREREVPSLIKKISGTRLDERTGLITSMKKKVKKLR
ncbi:MAG: hypothetical protein NC218_10960 [Acetobacter sp.]|nr:hypothetical protein [Acetobacter sp.]